MFAIMFRVVNGPRLSNLLISALIRKKKINNAKKSNFRADQTRTGL